ncbi:MAG: N-acetylgalactosamine 6-sulfate sulfatase (GALNS) [Opitutaceae bacterium]|nr:N-acetylgalactosamine 6-sulfate sulfatase (GALNS) [Opitutaceae bacterium]
MKAQGVFRLNEGRARSSNKPLRFRRLGPSCFKILQGQYLIILFLLISTFCFGRGPNVIFIMADDLGYGDLACLGNPHIQTPNLDRLYYESVRLTDYHVSHFCTPTRASLMTGRNASRTGAWRTTSGRTMLHTDEVTMAEVFRDNGYATGIFGKWHLGDSYPHRPQDRGFEESLWHRCGGVTQISDYWGNDYFDDNYEYNGEYKQFEGYCTDVWFKNALGWIKEKSDEGAPFFCYIPTNAPHGPFIVAEEYAAPYRNNPDIPNPEFFGMITNLDENVGKLRQKLEEWEITKDTLLIFTTDNGTSAGIKTTGNPDGWPTVGYNAGMRGKKASIYDGGHRVPCFVSWPKVDGEGISGGWDVGQLTAHYDWLPTFMELCGLKRKTGLPLDGRSLVPLLKDDNERWPERSMIRQYQGGVFFRFAPEPWRETVVMTERWRLVNGVELYKIQGDPAQRNDVSSRHPDVVKKLRSEYIEWWFEVEPRLKLPVRNHAGNTAENPLILTAQEWYIRPFGNPATNQRHVKSLDSVEGAWLLNIERSGSYKITLSQFPLEALQPIQAEKAWMRIGGITGESGLSERQESISLQVELEMGATELETAFIDEEGVSTSAYFAAVEFLGE